MVVNSFVGRRRRSSIYSGVLWWAHVEVSRGVVHKHVLSLTLGAVIVNIVHGSDCELGFVLICSCRRRRLCVLVVRLRSGLAFEAC